MTDIHDIPFEDVKKFLIDNRISFFNEDDAYNKALISLKKERKYYPESIIEWLIAHNLFVRKIDIPIYTIQEIDNMSQNEINQLAKMLTMKGNDPENIKNILRYLHKLDDISLLPEINDIILQKLYQLDIQDINFDNIKFNDIIDLLSTHSNKALLRKLINENIEKIVFYNVLDVDPKRLDDITYIEEWAFYNYISPALEFIKYNKDKILKNNTKDDINDITNFLEGRLNNKKIEVIKINMSNIVSFIIDLLTLGEIALAKRVFEISIKYNFKSIGYRHLLMEMSIEEYLGDYLVKSKAKADLINKVKKLY